MVVTKMKANVEEVVARVEEVMALIQLSGRGKMVATSHATERPHRRGHGEHAGAHLGHRCVQA